ncbi:glycoside hydrolase superfamily [Mariannaea sp. PMI_226]|nr:glycoside hydrolase superfamily [Mariannaea sp. PMI_226]
MRISSSLVAVATLASSVQAWLPIFDKIRGVNLGSVLLFEPWMSDSEWAATGCAGYNDEFTCNQNVQDASTGFQGHWDRWVNETDLDLMKKIGLNTIRIPLGYWIMEELVEDGEFYPKGGFDFLKQFCTWALEKGLYVILDLHGGPGVQTPNQQFTGHGVGDDDVKFYTQENYERAYKWIEWITNAVYDSPEIFGNVGMIELINEPLRNDQNGGAPQSLRDTYYKEGVNKIRAIEDTRNIPAAARLHVQLMAKSWNAGDPVEFLDDKSMIMRDDHHYYVWGGPAASDPDGLVNVACGEDRSNGEDGGDVIVGEWSIAIPGGFSGDEWDVNGNKDFYVKFFAAQVHAYESTANGWIFWSWRTDQGDDYRWSYKNAYLAGVIPDLTQITNPCQ